MAAAGAREAAGSSAEQGGDPARGQRGSEGLRQRVPGRPQGRGAPLLSQDRPAAPAPPSAPRAVALRDGGGCGMEKGAE